MKAPEWKRLRSCPCSIRVSSVAPAEACPISSVLAIPGDAASRAEVLRFIFLSPETLVSALFTYLVFHAAIAWHELGHFLVARALGSLECLVLALGAIGSAFNLDGVRPYVMILAGVFKANVWWAAIAATTAASICRTSGSSRISAEPAARLQTFFAGQPKLMSMTCAPISTFRRAASAIMAGS